jgi:hypothetical protein
VVLTGLLDTTGTTDGVDLLCVSPGTLAGYGNAHIVAHQASELHNAGL